MDNESFVLKLGETFTERVRFVDRNGNIITSVQKPRYEIISYHFQTICKNVIVRQGKKKRIKAKLEEECCKRVESSGNLIPAEDNSYFFSFKTDISFKDECFYFIHYKADSSNKLLFQSRKFRFKKVPISVTSIQWSKITFDQWSGLTFDQWSLLEF